MPRPSTQRFLIHDTPYGGFSLRARSVEAAWAKVSAFLDAVADSRTFGPSELIVKEPCEAAVAHAIEGGPLPEHTAARGPSVADVGAIIAATGHRFGSTAAAAVERFGLPQLVGYGTDKPRPEYLAEPVTLWATWGWRCDPQTEPDRTADFRDFCVAHQREELVCWTPPVVELSGSLEFVAGGAGTPGRLFYWLHGSTSAVSLDLRWPTPEVSAEFVAFYDKVNAALGVKIPESRWKVGIIGPSNTLTFKKLGFSRTDWP